MKLQVSFLRKTLFLALVLMSFLLTSCDLDILLEQALILDDPATFIGERQVQVTLSGSDLERIKESDFDLDLYIAQTLRSSLPPAWEAAWSIERETVILDFVLPFQGLEDYGRKVHGSELATSYIDLAGSSPGSFPLTEPDLGVAQPGSGGINQPDLGSDDIGREIFAREGDFLQAQIQGLANTYFEPLRHELHDEEGNLLFYLSLGEPDHWTKADLHFMEIFSESEFSYPDIREDFAELGETEEEPRFLFGGDLFIIGDQVYETVVENGVRCLSQSRVLPLELEVTTFSDDLFRFSRTLRLRLPQDPSGKSLERLAERLNLGIIDDLAFQPEGNTQNKIEAMSSKIKGVGISQIRDYTRLLLGRGYDLKLEEMEGTEFLWQESFDLPSFFPDREGPHVKIQGFFEDKLSAENRSTERMLTAQRSWPALALQTFWDPKEEAYVRRYHYFLNEVDMEPILTEYLLEKSLDDYPIFARQEGNYQQVFLEQRTKDPSEIAEQTSLLLGSSSLELTETNNLLGKRMNWVETYVFDKVEQDQAIHISDNESYQNLREASTMPHSGIMTLRLTLQSNLGILLGLGLLALILGSFLHPRSSLRALVLKARQVLEDRRLQKQREQEERPLDWGATFEDHKGRVVKIISVEQPEPEPRRRLRFR